MTFKNTQGKWLTKALFFELTPGARPYAIYTLKDEDHKDGKGTEYLSLKRLFLSCTDPTEYEFANKFLGGWKHWKVMQQVDELQVHIEEWREERDIRLRAEGVRAMIDMARTDGSFQAAKYLADKGWDDTKRGRPSKQEVQKAAKAQASIKGRVSSDLERLKRG